MMEVLVRRLMEENIFGMKEPVKGSLPSASTRVVSKQTSALWMQRHTCISLSRCFPQRLFHMGLEIMLRHSGLFTSNSRRVATGKREIKKQVWSRRSPRRPRRWTRCHRTRTWPCAWGSRAAGGRAGRGASAWRSSDWGRESHWRRRWRSGPEGDTTARHQNHTHTRQHLLGN